MEPALAELKERLGEIADLSAARSVLDWDVAVWMPPGGQAARASQLGTLQSVIHARESDDRIGELLEALEPYAASLDADDDDACLLRVARRNWERKRRIPTSLAAELASAEVDGYAAWLEARDANDFAVFRPQLERMLELKLRWVECYAPYDDPYDVLLDDYDEGLRAHAVADVFGVLRHELSGLVAEYADQPADDAFLSLAYPIATQDALSPEADRALRRNVGRVPARRHRASLRGSLRPARHPADDGVRGELARPRCSARCTNAGTASTSGGRARRSIVRRSQTARPRPSTSPRAGSGRTPSGGRSRSGAGSTPRFRRRSPTSSAPSTLDRFYRSINRVQRTFTRLDADETSYGLHVILRFELERKLVAGELAVSELPDAWNTLFARAGRARGSR